MTQTEQFLEQYKSLEALLRGVYGAGMTVLNYEDRSSEPEKLRICRQIRNFLQHTPDGAKFIVPTEAMCLFLRHESVQIASQAEKAKDLAYKQPPVKLTHTWQQAAKLLHKSNRTWLPVVNDKSELVGVLDKDSAFAQLISGKDLSTQTVGDSYTAKGLEKTLDGFTVMDCESLAAGYELDKVIVTRKGKYSGLIDLR